MRRFVGCRWGKCIACFAGRAAAAALLRAVALHQASGDEIPAVDDVPFLILRPTPIGKPGWALDRHSAGVAGWHRNNAVVDSFLVTEYGKGAVSKANASRGKVGVLSVTFAPAWKDQPRDINSRRSI